MKKLIPCLFLLLMISLPSCMEDDEYDAKNNITRIIKGSSRYGERVATVQNNKLKEGNICGTTRAIIKGNKIIEGSSIYGTTIALINGNEIIKGSSRYGTTIAHIKDDKIIEGKSGYYGLTIGRIYGNGGVNAGALGAVYLLLLE